MKASASVSVGKDLTGLLLDLSYVQCPVKLQHVRTDGAFVSRHLLETVPPALIYAGLFANSDGVELLLGPSFSFIARRCRSY
jgi:hypothetical protein